jgi:hypothetical protein
MSIGSGSLGLLSLESDSVAEGGELVDGLGGGVGAVEVGGTSRGDGSVRLAGGRGGGLLDGGPDAGGVGGGVLLDVDDSTAGDA